ncbi:MAG: hemolysin family protein [Halobacteriota archaeon]
MSTTVALIGVVAIVLLTAISAFFSSSELSVFSIARHRIDALVAADTPGSHHLASLRADPHRFLVTVLVSNNVANIAAGSVATAVLVLYLPAGQAATAGTAVTSAFVILFGEIAPKSYAVANAERHALRVARPVRVVQRLLWPVLIGFEVATRAINRLTGGEGDFETYLTREELETIVLGGESAGVLDATEGAMIRGVLDLRETNLRQVMVPRRDMVVVPASASIDRIVETAWQARVTRVPVYGENRDDIRGIVDLREALRARDQGLALGDVLTEVPLVPATKPVDELLAELREAGLEVAIVVDEFGTVVGLVTLEDLVEEVVGEIVGFDEADPVQPTDASTAVVRGWATVAYVNETLDLALPMDGPVVTIGGLLNYQLGRVPDAGETVSVDGVTITVLEATATRVERVRLERAVD